MNNKEFINELAQRTNYTQQNTQKMVLSVIEALVQTVEEEQSAQVPQFGTFEVKKRNERILVNPNNGKKMMVPPKLILGFRAASGFKAKLQKGGSGDE